MCSVTIEQFLSACEAWNLEEVHHAVESGFHVDTFDDDHVNGLQMAAATGNIGIVQYLLDRGADIEKTNQVGMTALHHAARNGHSNIIRVLVQRGANFQKLTYLGASALTLASGNGRTEVVKLLLNLRVNINPSHTALCPTPLIAASFRKHTHICALLAHRGAYLDANIQRLSNLSALSAAISCGATTVVAALLELGANSSYRSLNGLTASQLAQYLKRNEILPIINLTVGTAKKNEEPIEIDIRQLIYEKDENALRTLLIKRLPYIVLPENTTPLMYAVLMADISVVKAIYESGFTDVNAAESVSGLTAMMFAAIVGDYEVMDYFVRIGADISLMSVDGFTAVDYAFASGNINADLLCLLQERLEFGTNFPLHIDVHVHHHQHQHFSRVIHNREANLHVGFVTNSTDCLDSKGKPDFSKAHLARLVRIHQYGGQDFILAHDILRSIGKDKVESDDHLHCYIKTARYVAEICASQGFLNLPVVSSFENNISDNLTKYTPSPDNALSACTTINQKPRDFLSTAQMNAHLYYECRFPNRNSGGMKTVQTQRLYDYDSRREVSSSASASDYSPSMRLRYYSSLERASTYTLGTMPRYRSKSRETIKCKDLYDDDDGRSSPSRLSLNQYTFSIKDGERLKKSASTPTLDVLNRQFSFSRAKQIKEMGRNPRKTSEAKVATCDSYCHHRKQNITEDLIWKKLTEEGLDNYVNLLKDEEVDQATFLALTDNDLIDLGISNAMHRKTVLKIAKSFQC
ncbi:unnamed protein product [Thelazia callipaeda]|uniref:NAD(+) ADP-ribosyltransferase n=1 Tax=Thelazia callipaeda TaxID=103827 RepID=A0A0N5CX75_THECL|nr:unnamed protein product [Thelazia callipaeda]